MWETEYCKPDATNDANKEPVAKRAKYEHSLDIINHFMELIYHNKAAAADNNNFNTYVSGARLCVQDVLNIIKWWANLERQSPLAHLVLNVLSILVMSTECERLFSSVSNLVGSTRYSLHDGTMERLELLRLWLQNGIIELQGEK